MQDFHFEEFAPCRNRVISRERAFVAEQARVRNMTSDPAVEGGTENHPVAAAYR